MSVDAVGQLNRPHPPPRPPKNSPCTRTYAIVYMAIHIDLDAISAQQAEKTPSPLPFRRRASKNLNVDLAENKKENSENINFEGKALGECMRCWENK